MDTDLPDDFVQLADTELSSEALMARIRAQLALRKAAQGADLRPLPQFGVAGMPEEPTSADHDHNLYHHLRLANERFSELPSEALLAPSPATRMPVIGRWWAMMRRHAHDLVLYYVNRGLQHQLGVNRNIISVLNLLVRQNEAQRAEIDALRRQLSQNRQDNGAR